MPSLIQRRRKTQQRRKTRSRRARRFRVHACFERWLPLLQGYRTLLILLLAYPITHRLTERVIATDDAHLADALAWMAGIYTVLLLAYPVSKAATGLRNRWGGSDYDAGLYSGPADLADSDLYDDIPELP